ncbi:MAG: VTT domain-containing protein [Firmicutes bacterium]|nr:VTT domain-containing protein [Bacillota bacterium]
MAIEMKEVEEELEDEKSVKFLTVLEKLKLARRSKIKKFIFVIFMLGAVSTGAYFSFYALGFDIFGGTAPDIGGNVAAIITIFLVLYLVQSITLNIIPGTTTFFITVLAVSMFSELGVPLTFLISITAVLMSSVPLYFVGRFGGRKLMFWLFGREAVEKKLDWIARNGAKGVPWLFLIPFMTTDLLCVICGASKMNFWHFLLIVIVFRPIEVAMLVFLYPFILGELPSDPLILFLLINLLIVNFFLLVIYHRAILKIINRTFQFRKLEDLAATQVAIMEAAEKETQEALERAEAIEKEEQEWSAMVRELKKLRKEINELKEQKGLDKRNLKK